MLLVNDAWAQAAPAIEKRADVVEDGWEIRRESDGTTRTRRLTLHPQLEPIPALKYQLIPDSYDRTDGNSALFYLKAMAFLEETRAKELLLKFTREAELAARKTGDDDHAPYTWMETAPNELPIAEVKQFLKLLSFQEPLLRDAAYRTQFSLDRNIKAVDSPVAYLLPEINAMRQLARHQSVRLRLALAENRVDDAIEIAGQVLSMAEHLGRDGFFVSNLVGIAIAGIAWNDMMHIQDHPQAPNLYWAFAALPRPLVATRKGLDYERHLLFEQVKLLREVNASPKSEGYWEDFIDQFIAKSEAFEIILDSPLNLLKLDKEKARKAVAKLVADAYPGARRFLIDDAQMDLEDVDAYPKTQAVFLAMKMYSERARDEQLKWQFVEYPLAQTSPLRIKSVEKLEADAERLGWITKPAQALLPAVQAAATAVERNQQRFAILQTVEAIRFHAATHSGQLPRTLAELELPAPLDPITARPFEYRHDGEQAELAGAWSAGVRNQLVLQIAK